MYVLAYMYVERALEYDRTVVRCHDDGDDDDGDDDGDDGDAAAADDDADAADDDDADADDDGSTPSLQKSTNSAARNKRLRVLYAQGWPQTRRQRC